MLYGEHYVCPLFVYMNHADPLLRGYLEESLAIGPYLHFVDPYGNARLTLL